MEAQSRADAINAFRRLGTNGAVQVVKGAATADWIAKAKRTRGVALLGAEVVEAPEVS